LSKDSELLLMPPTLENHHRLLTRHAHIIQSHTNQLITADQRFKAFQETDPMKELKDLELQFLEKLHKVEAEVRVEVTRVRTALYIAALMLGGGYGSGKAIEALKEPQPINVQVVAPKVQP